MEGWKQQLLQNWRRRRAAKCRRKARVAQQCAAAHRRHGRLRQALLSDADAQAHWARLQTL